MIILDTNVVSELVRQAPEPAVVAWLDSVPRAEAGITAITVAELLYGVARLPSGRRRSVLATAIEKLVTEQFDGRVDAFGRDGGNFFTGDRVEDRSAFA